MIKFPSPHDRVLPHKIKVTFPDDGSARSDTLDRVIGSLVGLATGDALGASVEFRPHEYLRHHPVTDMQKGGTWGLSRGQWTDDTSMALCLASSLVTKRRFDPYDQMVRYKWWFKHGFLSSTGHCFDIGSATRHALDEFSRRQKLLHKVYQCRTEEEVDRLSLEQVKAVKEFSLNCSSVGVAGNGPLMRLAPVPLFYFRSPNEAIDYAGRSATLTHGDKIASDACRYYAALIVAAIRGEPKEQILADRFYDDHRDWFGSSDLHPAILEVANGSYKRAGGYNDGIRGKGYIVNSLEAALWAFYYDENSFKTGVLSAIHLGDDTDTTAAIYGQLAGAYYGWPMIPENWRRQLYANELITCIGHWLHCIGEEQSLIGQSSPSEHKSQNERQAVSEQLAISERSLLRGQQPQNEQQCASEEKPPNEQQSVSEEKPPNEQETEKVGEKRHIAKANTGFPHKLLSTLKSLRSGVQKNTVASVHSDNNLNLRRLPTSANQPRIPQDNLYVVQNRDNKSENIGTASQRVSTPGLPSRCRSTGIKTKKL
ncbi:unnamed protein product [Rotaria socialis]